MDQKFALIIDADNVSAKYIKPILDELSKYGNVTYKRIYGDWTNSQNISWKEVLLKNSISPIQQFSYTYGKNATDSAMIIDAMDILYTQSVDGFCIVSSDSDFTRLAARIRESGIMVIGMGEKKTPAPFRKACDVFTELELLIEDHEEDSMTEAEKSAANVEPVKKSGKKSLKLKEQRFTIKHAEMTLPLSKEQIEEAVIKIITENQNNDRVTGLSEIGNRLLKLYPDFDVRSYGYSLLSKFLDEFTKIKLVKKGNSISVELREDTDMRESLENYIIRYVQSFGSGGVVLGTLANQVYQDYSNFKTRDYGYSQFHKFIRSIPQLEVRESDKELRVYYR